MDTWAGSEQGSEKRDRRAERESVLSLEKWRKESALREQGAEMKHAEQQRKAISLPHHPHCPPDKAPTPQADTQGTQDPLVLTKSWAQ